MPAAMTMLADHPARQLLDFSQKLDINLLDNVVNSMYHDIGSQVRVTFFPITGLFPHYRTNGSIITQKTSLFFQKLISD